MIITSVPASVTVLSQFFCENITEPEVKKIFQTRLWKSINGLLISGWSRKAFTKCQKVTYGKAAKVLTTGSI